MPSPDIRLTLPRSTPSAANSHNGFLHRTVLQTRPTRRIDCKSVLRISGLRHRMTGLHAVLLISTWRPVMATFAVILPAAGRSSRFKDKEKKPFVNLDGRAIWLRSAELFVARNDVAQTIIVIAP